jgi:putative iron-dependent peroxidase
MPRTQIDIERDPKTECRFLIMRVHEPTKNGAAVLRRLAALPAAIARIGAIDSGAELTCVVGFGAEFWDSISPARRPAALVPFKLLRSDGRSAPATGGDLMFHIISGRADLSFILAFELTHILGDVVEVVDDVRSMFYLDSRDLTGFIDGTENPKGAERTAAAIIGDEDREFAGGTYVFNQRYIHNLKKWVMVAPPEQEKVIGRSKPDSVELSDEVKPRTAHIARVVIEENGEELQIVRYSFPYGTVIEAGLMFIAYARDLATPQKMLSRMVGAAGDGVHDHLLDFTRPVSGAHFFVPSVDLLEQLTSAAKA